MQSDFLGGRSPIICAYIILWFCDFIRSNDMMAELLKTDGLGDAIALVSTMIHTNGA